MALALRRLAALRFRTTRHEFLVLAIYLLAITGLTGLLCFAEVWSHYDKDSPVWWMIVLVPAAQIFGWWIGLGRKLRLAQRRNELR